MLERMQAVVQQAFGGPEVLEVAEVTTGKIVLAI